jgi:type IV pilus assembly protein PilC
MIRAGEAGGVLDKVLDRLAKFREKAERIQKKVKSAMVYPGVIMSVAVIIVYILMVKVVPSVPEAAWTVRRPRCRPSRSSSSASPVPHRVLVGHPDRHLRPLFGLKSSARLRQGQGGLRQDDLQACRRSARSSRSCPSPASAAYLRHADGLGRPDPAVHLDHARDTLDNVVIAQSLERVHDRVRDGEPLSIPLEQSGVFPQMVTSMIQVGEETGQFPEMLNRVADIYDEEVDNAVTALTSIIEPILIVFLAVVVGTIVLAMFLPLDSLITKMTGGG